MSAEPGVWGSQNTSIADTVIIVKDGGVGSVPGGVVYAGDWDVFFLAVCDQCGDMVAPFSSKLDRDTWAAGHCHPVKFGIEIREP